jgi:hypothetical protein
MSNASPLRIAALGCLAAATLFAFLGAALSAPRAHAQATTLNSTVCNQLYGLPAGTISTTISSQYLNPTVCAAMQDLISRYNPGGCSSKGFTNAKVQGITSLNSVFAVNLDTMLKAADAAGYHITINSAYRSPAGEQCANPTAYGRGFVSMHTKGLAADLQYPNDANSLGECDGSASNLSAAYLWVNANDATYHLGQYDQLHSHVQNECNHVEERSGTSDSTLGPGATGAAPTTPLQAVTNALGITTPSAALTCPPGYVMQNNACTPQTGSPIYSTPGLGATPQVGQILAQDTYCLVSTNPVITVPVPAGTPYPSGCLSNQQMTTGTQLYCSGNTVVYNASGVITPVQICSSSCSNGACVQQSCPVGYTLVNGFCSQSQQQTTQPAASSAATPATGVSSAATQASTATQTSSGSGATASIPNVSTSLITAPTLVPNLGTSTLALLQALANPQPSSAAAATTTPITLSGAAVDISQLEASPLPGVTYAQATGSLFPSSGQTGQTGSAGGGTGSGSTNNITTTAGTGYDVSGNADSATPVNAGTAGDIANTQAPGGADTFGSGTASNASAPSSFSGNAPSTFNSALVILGTLKSEVLNALSFLSVYVKPFGGNIPNQAVNE